MQLSFALQLHRPGFYLDAVGDFSADGITAITGPSGCGKSTLLRGLTGLTPMAGTIHLHTPATAHNSATQRPLHHMPPRLRPIAWVPQEPRWPQQMTVKGLWQCCLSIHGIQRTSAAQLTPLAQQLAIQDVWHHKPEQLSGGQKQRAAIGAALLRPAAILLLDEPFAGLDPEAATRLLAAIRQHKAQNPTKIIAIVSHNHQAADAFSQQMQMTAGRIQHQGPLSPTPLVRVNYRKLERQGPYIKLTPASKTPPLPAIFLDNNPTTNLALSNGANPINIALDTTAAIYLQTAQDRCHLANHWQLPITTLKPDPAQPTQSLVTCQCLNQSVTFRVPTLFCQSQSLKSGATLHVALPPLLLTPNEVDWLPTATT